VLGELVRACRNVISKPLWVKLTPNTSDIVALARACAESGADAVSVINTITGMAIDAHTRKPRLATIFGGLSGPAIKPIALRMVYQIHRAGLGIPICGIGGIQNGLDAVEFFLAGASAVQVGTQNFIDPSSAERIVHEIEDFCRPHSISDLTELVGALSSQA
jgi:dihydroorotate dehydrogenase (NAD+) catalytic subunit